MRNSSSAIIATGVSCEYWYGTFSTSGSRYALLVPNTTLCGSPFAAATSRKPSAPAPPDLFVTMIDWSISLCLTMIDCTRRANWSVPPPAPDGTTNSTGFVGFQSAADAAAGNSSAAATAAASP